MTKTLIVHPVISASSGKDTHEILSGALEEARGLAAAIKLDIYDVIDFKVTRIQAGSFLGKGQRASIAEIVADNDIEIVVFNHALSPVQQRNLEREWDCKVIDRTGLILEIFGARAQTKEGRLQVELAALDYQRSRLVRSWTHLERQRGGAGFMGGPGETQIELDRRMIAARISKIKKELEQVRRTRDLGRQSRARVPLSIVALVGYTNAGKSTLFNTLTGAQIFAKNLLFATLDPTMRRIELPQGQGAILSDTVGFISDLPTHLIEAFRATLEQIAYADVIAHVIDVSREDWQAQRKDVIKVLSDLGINYDSDSRVIELYNKIDVIDADTLNAMQRKAKFDERAVAVSALKGAGIDAFIAKAGEIISAQDETYTFTIPQSGGKALAWLYEHGKVIEIKSSNESDDANKTMISITVSLSSARAGQFKSLFC